MSKTAALNDAITLLIAYSAEITTAQVNPATGHVDDADARRDIARIGDTVTGLRSLMYALAAPAPQPCLSDERIDELWQSTMTPLSGHRQFARAVIDEAIAAQASQSEPVATDAMVDAYLKANDAYWREVDALPTDATKPWRQGTPREATRVSLQAALRYFSVNGSIVTDVVVQSMGMALAKQHAVYLTTDSVRKLLEDALAAAPDGDDVWFPGLPPVGGPDQPDEYVVEARPEGKQP